MKRLLCASAITALAFLFSCHRQTARQTSGSVPPPFTRGTENIQLTNPGSKPFHLKAVVVEATNLQNDSYKAEIEEYWVAPDKWRRVVKSEGFSSDYIVSGSAQSELITGDYYPNWLRTIVTAILDPGAPLQALDVNAPSDNPMPGSALSCRRYSTRVGIAPAQNNVFSTVCFRGSKLASVGLPGYHAEYKEFEDFDGKQVPRAIREYIEPGTDLEAKIIELTELSTYQDSMFIVKTPISQPISIVTVNEDTLRKLASTRLDLNWPPTRGGKTEGTLSIYVCLDRTGRVRETYALNSDNAGMSEAAQQQLENTQFSPVTGKQGALQAEGILTFAFKTTENPYPELTNEEAQGRLIELFDYPFPQSVPKGTIATVSVLVGKDGKVSGSGPFLGLPPQVGSLAPDFTGWKFKPLLIDGEPTPFKVNLKFMVH